MRLCACAHIPTHTQTFITQKIKIIMYRKILNFPQNDLKTNSLETQSNLSFNLYLFTKTENDNKFIIAVLNVYAHPQ